MRRNLNSKTGVTLTELIVAMVILVAVAIPMSAMIGAQIQGMMSSADLTASGNLARQEMERLNNLSYASLTTGNSTINGYAIDWNVTTVTGAGGAERKDITLTAKRAGTASVLVTLYSSLAKDVTYTP